tara:strand:+ start:41 stop:217 length:177 start_codon:yes stop_codon:yes gene_type:complete
MASFMKMNLHINKSQQTPPPPPPVHYESAVYKMGFISTRKCSALVIQGKKSCASCGGK